MSHQSITVHLPAEHSLLVSSTAFNGLEIRLIGNTATQVQTILTNRTIRVGPFSDPREYRLSSELNSFTYTIEEEKLAYNHEGTGIFEGGQVTINADPTKIDIAAGTGLVVDNYTDPEIPNVIHITWPDLVGIDVEFLATEFGSFVGIDATGAVQQFPASEPDIDKRDNIFLGILGHSNLTTVTSIASAPTPGYDQTHMIVDMTDSIGIINKSGNVYGPSGADLEVDKTAGESFALGYNHTNSAKSPNITNDPALETATLFPAFRDGTGGFTAGSPVTDVPIANYDNNSGAPFAVPASDPWQIFRIYWSPAINNNIIAYGQNVYKNQAIAEGAIFGEVYDEAPELSNAILRAYLIVRRDATDLSDTGTAKFIQANNFGGAPASGVSTATTTLQQAYANSDEPEIVTNTTQQAVTFKEGTGTATNKVIDILNNDDLSVLSINGLGQLTGSINAGVTGSRPGSPIDYQMYFDTTLGIPIWYDGTNWIDATGATV